MSDAHKLRNAAFAARAQREAAEAAGSQASYGLRDAVGLPESQLPGPLVDLLKDTVAAAPWQTRCRVITWMHPVGPAALETIPAAIRPSAIAMVAWALVRYEHTPVGPYDEIAATLIPEGGDGYGHIPFIAVDSYPSIIGGRANWLLPKSLARFVWSEDGLSANVTADAPAKPGWSLTVSTAPSGDPSPVEMPNHVQQVSTAGAVRRFDGAMAGTMWSASVTVDAVAEGPVSALLIPGSYQGSVLTDCTFNVGPLNAV